MRPRMDVVYGYIAIPLDHENQYRLHILSETRAIGPIVICSCKLERVERESDCNNMRDDEEKGYMHEYAHNTKKNKPN